MSLQAAIKRLALIIEKISRSNLPSKKEIIEYIRETGIKISERTLDRDFEKLRDEFGVDLRCNNLNQYYIITENSPEFESFIRLIELNETAELITTNLKEGKKNLKYIDFETSSGFKGLQQLKELFTAIRDSKYLSFHHTKYQTDEKKTFFNIEPYLLKEFKNRWYLIAKFKGEDQFITFGIDRITDLKISEKKFKKDLNICVQDLFKDIIGLVYSNSTIEEVLFEVDETQAKYFESLPWHESQQIFKKENKTFMKLIIKPNFELEQRIMMYGDLIEVIKPNWLRKEIAKNHQEAAKKYSY